jgi:hypothetical protein
MIAVWSLVSEAEVCNFIGTTGTGHKLGALHGVGDMGVGVMMIVLAIVALACALAAPRLLCISMAATT